ncbi:thioesterase family protein [Bradyrhizobium sp. 2TAF24]|uniref:thioesterase family protein n=1 Tax=Bradyrhizobium sp. 2TAF24 TaxID=3233011 RepID=UPI003F91FC38
MNEMAAISIGMSAERGVTVTDELTVAHVAAHMPRVYATPMMILLMEMAATVAIAPHLPDGFVSVGTEVNVRHLAATPVGRLVRATARVIRIDGRSVLFDVAAFDGDRKIGDGTHRRGVINVAKFEKRFSVA